MRNNILYITLMILAMALTACAPVEDDIFTTARITVAATDGTSIQTDQREHASDGDQRRLCGFHGGR